MTWLLEFFLLLLFLLFLCFLNRRRVRLLYYDYRQRILAKHVIFGRDDFVACHLVGGIDISFVKNDNVGACISLVVVNMETLEKVYSRTKMIRMTCPYIPGYLAFRETPHICAMLRETKRAFPQFYPDVLIVDGNGRLHAKEFGLACHTGVVCGVPCIGVAKNLYQMESCIRDTEHRNAIEKMEKKGDYFNIPNISGTTIGCAVRTTADSRKPVYVSEGHRISLETARDIVVRCSKYRVPEPVRLADQESREVLRQ